MAQMEKNLNVGDLGLILGKIPLERGMVTHFTILTWSISRTEECDGQVYGVTKSRTQLSMNMTNTHSIREAVNVVK